MPGPEKSHVCNTLTPFHERIRGVVERAWEEWKDVLQFRQEHGFGPIMYSRTTANYIFDAIARNSIAEFGIDPSVKIKVDAQTVKFIFRSEVIGRFKKGDENKLGMNIPTRLSLAFTDPEEVFPGLPPETAKVDFVWTASELGTNLEGVYVVARDNERLLWDYEIDRSSHGAVFEFMLESDDPDPHGPSGSGNEDLVTPKGGGSRESGEE
jgi:hypothetical protein